MSKSRIFLIAVLMIMAVASVGFAAYGGWDNAVYGTQAVTGTAIATVSIKNAKDIWVQNIGEHAAQMSVQGCGGSTITHWVTVPTASIPIVIPANSSGLYALRFECGTDTTYTTTINYWYFQSH